MLRNFKQSIPPLPNTGIVYRIYSKDSVFILVDNLQTKLINHSIDMTPEISKIIKYNFNSFKSIISIGDSIDKITGSSTK